MWYFYVVLVPYCAKLYDVPLFPYTRNLHCQMSWNIMNNAYYSSYSSSPNSHAHSALSVIFFFYHITFLTHRILITPVLNSNATSVTWIYASASHCDSSPLSSKLPYQSYLALKLPAISKSGDPFSIILQILLELM